MRNKILYLGLGAMLFALCVSAQAQQPKKVPRIGYLSSGSPSTNLGYLQAFLQGLRELGYVEGKNVLIEYKWAEGRFERMPELAEELVRLKVDIIIAPNSAIARAAKKATSTIPIVMANAGNPFGEGLVANLAHPGGNVTGLTNLSQELSGKRLELLKQIFPTLVRAAVLSTPPGRGQERRDVKELLAAATFLKLQLQILEVRIDDEFEKAFEDAAKARATALVVTSEPSGLLLRNRKQIVELSSKNRLPAIYPQLIYVNIGGLMSYAANELEMYRRAATYVDKILKGAKPAELPVEQPTKFEFIINLKAAKQIDLPFPPNVLALADKVIR
ncbi:MAG TPA: ABC transporter substrate-binding protein [Candidatus Acidoferrum sp.]|nr:ABC transporter substrate-binding protein [Candidatus Acidoferrum sp.]